MRSWWQSARRPGPGSIRGRRESVEWRHCDWHVVVAPGLRQVLCRPLEYADRDVLSLVLRGWFGCGVGIFDRGLAECDGPAARFVRVPRERTLVSERVLLRCRRGVTCS